jgi:hypothetical protein
MELDTKTYWLTVRQSQYDFDFDFDYVLDSGVKKYIPSFLKIGSGIQNLIVNVIHRERSI